MSDICKILLLTAMLASCAAENGKQVVQTERIFAPEPVKTQKGKASFYYGRWIGRLTANGEIYRADDVTAAHKYLPFNTPVRVTNLENGKSVVVRINNRGPYIKGRIIDLSLAAATALDMKKRGVVPVKVEVLEPEAEREVVRQYIDSGQFERREDVL